jgi:hypothetical protein
VGSNTSLRQQIVLAFHSSPVGGHSGFPVTYRSLISLFKWPGMKKDVKTLVSTCYICQQAKPEHYVLGCCSLCLFLLVRGQWQRWTSLTDCQLLAISFASW